MSSKILSWFCFEKIMTMLKISISYEFDTSYDISCYKKILWQCHDSVRLNGNSMTLSCHVIWQKSLWQKMNHFSIKYGFSYWGICHDKWQLYDNFRSRDNSMTMLCLAWQKSSWHCMTAKTKRKNILPSNKKSILKQVSIATVHFQIKYL